MDMGADMDMDTDTDTDSIFCFGSNRNSICFSSVPVFLEKRKNFRFVSKWTETKKSAFRKNRNWRLILFYVMDMGVDMEDMDDMDIVFFFYFGLFRIVFGCSGYIETPKHAV
jgi:hypothetical protein